MKLRELDITNFIQLIVCRSGNIKVFGSLQIFDERVLLCRRHTLYGAKIVDITYDDKPKLLYYTINLGGQNTVENG